MGSEDGNGKEGNMGTERKSKSLFRTGVNTIPMKGTENTGKNRRSLSFLNRHMEVDLTQVRRLALRGKLSKPMTKLPHAALLGE